MFGPLAVDIAYLWAVAAGESIYWIGAAGVLFVLVHSVKKRR